jgi:hypothetical protein
MNVTKDHFTILHPACFVNLRILRISPQNVGDEMIEMLSNSQHLEELHLVQNTYTGYTQPVSPNVWFRVNHLFRVYLRYTIPLKDLNPNNYAKWLKAISLIQNESNG